MWQVASYPLCLLCLGGLLGGCFTELKARQAATEEQARRAQQIAEEALDRAATLETTWENEKRRADRERYCKSDQIADFMAAIQEGLSDSCTPIRMAEGLNILYTLPTAVTHQDPTTGSLVLRKARLGQIRYILDPDKLHSSTRLLLMAKPAFDTPAGRERALELARRLKTDVLKKELPQLRPPGAKDAAIQTHEIPILGPYLLPCELAHNIEVLYKKAFFHPISGEPSLGKPAIVLFLIVSDC
jgi:hypothetical protein